MVSKSYHFELASEWGRIFCESAKFERSESARWNLSLFFSEFFKWKKFSAATFSQYRKNHESLISSTLNQFIVSLNIFFYLNKLLCVYTHGVILVYAHQTVNMFRDQVNYWSLISSESVCEPHWFQESPSWWVSEWRDLICHRFRGSCCRSTCSAEDDR